MNARDEAIEVMALAMYDAWRLLPGDEDGWDSCVSTATAALDALLSPQSTECETCGGTGKKADGFQHPRLGMHELCPSCNGSGRVEKGPIAYLSAELEHVEWRGPNGTFSLARAEDGPPRDGNEWWQIVRLPSESTNGVKDE